MFILPDAFSGQGQRVVCAYPTFRVKGGLSAARFLAFLIERMRNRPEDFGELRDEASFVEKHIEDARGRFILLKSEVSPESIREKLSELSLKFYGKALSPEEHCFEIMHGLPMQEAAAR